MLDTSCKGRQVLKRIMNLCWKKRNAGMLDFSNRLKEDPKSDSDDDSGTSYSVNLENSDKSLRGDALYSSSSSPLSSSDSVCLKSSSSSEIFKADTLFRTCSYSADDESSLLGSKQEINYLKRKSNMRYYSSLSNKYAEAGKSDRKKSGFSCCDADSPEFVHQISNPSIKVTSRLRKMFRKLPSSCCNRNSGLSDYEFSSSSDNYENDSERTSYSEGSELLDEEGSSSDCSEEATTTVIDSYSSDNQSDRNKVGLVHFIPERLLNVTSESSQTESRSSSYNSESLFGDNESSDEKSSSTGNISESTTENAMPDFFQSGSNSREYSQNKRFKEISDLSEETGSSTDSSEDTSEKDTSTSISEYTLNESSERESDSRRITSTSTSTETEYSSSNTLSSRTSGVVTDGLGSSSSASSDSDPPVRNNLNNLLMMFLRLMMSSQDSGLCVDGLD